MILAALYLLDAKFWGVVVMGARDADLRSFLPWLDRSPVKSIRYRAALYKTSRWRSSSSSFLVLGYLGTQTADRHAGTRIAQVGTILYFAFFLLMPWYTAIDKAETGAGEGDVMNEARHADRGCSRAPSSSRPARPAPRPKACKLDDAHRSSRPTCEPAGGRAHLRQLLPELPRRAYMRYNRSRPRPDRGADPRQPVFTAEKVGEPMKIAMRPRDGKDWFGAAPPDLSVIAPLARRRLALHLPAQLLPRPEHADRLEQRSCSRTSACRTRSGSCRASARCRSTRSQGRPAISTRPAAHKIGSWSRRPGSQTPCSTTRTVRDLVNFLVYVGEPHRQAASTSASVVLFVLGVLFVLAYALKKEYWKDVH